MIQSSDWGNAAAKSGIVPHPCDLITGETEAGKLQSLGYIARPCHFKKVTAKHMQYKM